VASIPLPVSIIAEVDIYKCDPWELPGLSFYAVTWEVKIFHGLKFLFFLLLIYKDG